MPENIYFDGQRPELLAFLPADVTTVLEIGCADGGFWASLPHTVAEIWAVEPHLPSAQKAESRAAIGQGKVLFGTFEDAEPELPNNYFDLIICNDVIEHMPDHDKFLASLKSKLSRNGHLVGSVPNIRYFRTFKKLLLNGEWDYEDEGILDRTHLRFFTKNSLIKTFIRHDFEIEKLHGINFTKRFKFFLLAMNIITFWNAADMRYMQFGFRVKVKHAK